MAADVCFYPQTDRGREILDELERKTGVLPFRTKDDGTRCYALSADGVDVAGFDPMLDRVDSDWAEHISRTQ